MNETETLDKGGTQESMEVTLAVTYCIGDMEPEEATSCTDRNPTEVIELPTHAQNFQTKILSCLQEKHER
jgi:hypothetical protein